MKREFWVEINIKPTLNDMQLQKGKRGKKTSTGTCLKAELPFRHNLHKPIKFKSH